MKQALQNHILEPSAYDDVPFEIYVAFSNPDKLLNVAEGGKCYPQKRGIACYILSSCIAKFLTSEECTLELNHKRQIYKKLNKLISMVNDIEGLRTYSDFKLPTTSISTKCLVALSPISCVGIFIVGLALEGPSSLLFL